MCSACQSFDHVWTPVPQQSRVYTWTVTHHPMHPDLTGQVPYTVVLVSVDGHPGIRFLGQLVDSDPSALQIGSRAEAVFEEVNPGVTLVNWKLTGE